jgi:fumarylacetoacetase
MVTTTEHRVTQAPVVGFGIFSTPNQLPRVGFRMGDRVFDLFEATSKAEFAEPSLNAFMAVGRDGWLETIDAILALRNSDAHWIAADDVTTHLPFEVADFIDFYSSLEHATNLGRLFRGETAPLGVNWRWMPIGYHGRAGSIQPSGVPVRRPWGHVLREQGRQPEFTPTEKLDFELELAYVVGASTVQAADPEAASDAHIFGLVLLNDWSARDIQQWEYQPLGPFLGKSFATSISSWVTPLCLLDGQRVPLTPQEPMPLRHLMTAEGWALDIELTVELNGYPISRTNARSLYWSPTQLVAHAMSNGSALRTGDILATGTISGRSPGTEGSMIELTGNGQTPIRVGDDARAFLEDGDEVRFTATAGRLSLGEVFARVLPAPPLRNCSTVVSRR